MLVMSSGRNTRKPVAAASPIPSAIDTARSNGVMAIAPQFDGLYSQCCPECCKIYRQTRLSAAGALLFDPLRGMRDGRRLLRVMVDPKARILRSGDFIDLVHRGLRLAGIEVEFGHAPMDEVSLKMGDVATQYDASRLWKANEKRAMSRRMPRSRNEA